MKKLIAACIDRIIDFDSRKKLQLTSPGCEIRKLNSVLSYREAVDGKYRVRVQEQYNKTPMIEG